MSVLKRHYFAVVYFSLDATNQEMIAERNATVNKIKLMGFTDPEIIIRGPFLANLASGTLPNPPAPVTETNLDDITFTPCKVATLEVRP